MRNRAKCKLCETVIESFHATDLIACKCTEIFVDGGNAMYCGANDWKNFVRVDDLDNEIIVTVKSSNVNPVDIEKVKKPNKKELQEMLEEMIKEKELLHPDVLCSPVNHYELLSFMILISSIFKTKK